VGCTQHERNVYGYFDDNQLHNSLHEEAASHAYKKTYSTEPSYKWSLVVRFKANYSGPFIFLAYGNQNLSLCADSTEPSILLVTITTYAHVPCRQRHR